MLSTQEFLVQAELPPKKPKRKINPFFFLLGVCGVIGVIDKFWDPQNWGFFDTEEQGEGFLKGRLKNIADTPT
jgi:hypothetical protein